MKVIVLKVKVPELAAFSDVILRVCEYVELWHVQKIVMDRPSWL